EVRHMGLLTVHSTSENFNRAAAHDVERIAGLALAADRLTTAELRFEKIRHQRRELILVEPGQEIHLPKRRDELTLPAVVTRGHSRHPSQVDGANRKGNLDTVAAKHVPEARHDLVAYGVLSRVVGHPEPDAVLHGEV